MSKIRFLCVTVLLLTAGQAVGQDVRYNFDKAAAFSKFKTYVWVTIKNAAPVDDLTDKQIKAALDAALAQKGLTKVEGENVDLFIVTKWLSEANDNLLYKVAGGATVQAGTVADGMGRVAGSQLDKRRPSTPGNSMWTGTTLRSTNWFGEGYQGRHERSVPVRRRGRVGALWPGVIEVS